MLRGKWAQGLEPRFFRWIIRDRLAGCERPGGHARNHRKVRRTEEIVWLRQQGFTHVVSLLEASHNLHAYEELNFPAIHMPIGKQGELHERLPDVLRAIGDLLADPGARLAVHHEDFGDLLAGVFSGYLLYADLLEDPAQAIIAVERLTGSQMGPTGREIVAITVNDHLKRSS